LFLVGSYLAQPILRLRKASQAVAAGDLSARAGAAVGDRKDEIGDLVRDFDRMAVRIEALVQSQKQLLRDISHDLRSPLQRLRMAVGLARREATSSNQLDRIEREAIRINELVEQVLTSLSSKMQTPSCRWRRFRCKLSFAMLWRTRVSRRNGCNVP